jgi:hypothetical protein
MERQDLALRDDVDRYLRPWQSADGPGNQVAFLGSAEVAWPRQEPVRELVATYQRDVPDVPLPELELPPDYDDRVNVHRKPDGLFELDLQRASLSTNGSAVGEVLSSVSICVTRSPPPRW